MTIKDECPLYVTPTLRIGSPDSHAVVLWDCVRNGPQFPQRLTQANIRDMQSKSERVRFQIPQTSV
jgi:hypothetical protein